MRDNQWSRKALIKACKKEIAEWQQEYHAPGFDEGMKFGALQAYNGLLRMLEEKKESTVPVCDICFISH